MTPKRLFLAQQKDRGLIVGRGSPALALEAHFSLLLVPIGQNLVTWPSCGKGGWEMSPKSSEIRTLEKKGRMERESSSSPSTSKHPRAPFKGRVISCFSFGAQCHTLWAEESHGKSERTDGDMSLDVESENPLKS